MEETLGRDSSKIRLQRYALPEWNQLGGETQQKAREMVCFLRYIWETLGVKKLAESFQRAGSHEVREQVQELIVTVKSHNYSAPEGVSAESMGKLWADLQQTLPNLITHYFQSHLESNPDEEMIDNGMTTDGCFSNNTADVERAFAFINSHHWGTYASGRLLETLGRRLGEHFHSSDVSLEELHHSDSCGTG